MTREEFLEFHDECTKKMKQICVAKNADYAGRKSDNPFANFTRIEAMGVATVEQGFLTRMIDKLSRLATFAESGQLMVKDESVEDTILDLCNYGILLAGYLKQKKDAT
jgi:hypothetical protein